MKGLIKREKSERLRIIKMIAAYLNLKGAVQQAPFYFSETR
jgi:hypothetical protein